MCMPVEEGDGAHAAARGVRVLIRSVLGAAADLAPPGLRHQDHETAFCEKLSAALSFSLL